MASGRLARTLDSLGARDPARERLRKTLYVVAGILCSVLWGYGVIHVLHADHALLTVSVFLSLMSGLFVKDSTARARVITSALLVPTVVVLPLVATALHSQRELQLVVFVLISGIAVWIRRYGARTTAVGTVAFFAYFFTLFMHPTPKDLPAFCLILAGAVGMQFVMKLIMWQRRHPERELGVMLRELRVATSAALDAAASPARSRSLHARLDRVDSMWRAITDWQQSFDTAAYTDWDADTLALSVMDACVHTEEACQELAAVHSTAHLSAHATALDHVRTALDERAPAARLHAALNWADTVVSEVDARASDDLGGNSDAVDYRLAECVLAHARLNRVGLHVRDLAHEKTTAAPETAGSVSASATGMSTPSSSPSSSSHTPAPTPSRRAPRLHWTPWRDWDPTSRLAVQAMTATALASVVGEAISATRWYWAVLTAFLVFLSTTTRSGILTRASRRIQGTVLGLVAGIALVYLAHGNTGVLLAICLLCIMGMSYFGPLNYLYASFFITTMLVAMYDMLGVLHGKLLETRLEETVAGCICGVVCAYLLLSTTSRPSLVAKIDVYFDAVDGLLQEASKAIVTPADVTALLGRIHAVEAAQADVEKTIDAMSAALVLIGRDRVNTARSLMTHSSRSSVRFAQLVITSATDTASDAGLSRHHDTVASAVAAARDAAALARRRIDRPNDPDETTTDTTPQTTATPATIPATGSTAASAVVAVPTTTTATATATTTAAAPATPEKPERPSPDVSDPTVRSALIALARFSWVMHRLSDVLEPAEDRRHTRIRAHAL